MIFYVAFDGGVEQVQIFLDDRLLTQLNEPDECAWQGLIEYVEDEIAHLDR